MKRKAELLTDITASGTQNMFLKAAINGVRTTAYHPRLPFRPDEAATESAQCIAAGANAIHAHVWNDNGVESLHPTDVAAYVSAIRAACPDTQVGISTGEWIAPNLETRLALIEAWDVVPDFVSLNTDEDGFEAVAEVLFRKGIGIEAGLANTLAATRFRAWAERKRCLRIMLEPNETTLAEARDNVKKIEAIVDVPTSDVPRLLHGLDDTTWPLLRLAAQSGYDSRIGFEDSCLMPDGTLAASNEPLIRAAIDIIGQEKSNSPATE